MEPLTPLPGNASGMLGVENLDPPRRPTPVRVLRCRSEGPMIVDVIDGEGYTVGRRGVKPGDEFDARERVARALQSRGRATIIADPDVAAREEEQQRQRAVTIATALSASKPKPAPVVMPAPPTLPADPSERCFVRVLRPHRGPVGFVAVGSIYETSLAEAVSRIRRATTLGLEPQIEIALGYDPEAQPEEHEKAETK
jgi:hypothetical protein